MVYIIFFSKVDIDSIVFDVLFNNQPIPISIPPVSEEDTLDFEQGGFSMQFWLEFFKVSLILFIILFLMIYLDSKKIQGLDTCRIFDFDNSLVYGGLNDFNITEKDWYDLIIRIYDGMFLFHLLY